MSRFQHHKYTWTKPFGSVKHNWELVGPDGAVHFHVGFYDPQAPSAGLEFHHSRSAGRYNGEAPHHIKCWLTGEPCWHDGTSLYASESLWPMVEPMFRNGDHETIFRVLEGEYDRHFGGRSEAED